MYRGIFIFTISLSFFSPALFSQQADAKLEPIKAYELRWGSIKWDSSSSGYWEDRYEDHDIAQKARDNFFNNSDAQQVFRERMQVALQAQADNPDKDILEGVDSKLFEDVVRSSLNWLEHSRGVKVKFPQGTSNFIKADMLTQFAAEIERAEDAFGVSRHDGKKLDLTLHFQVSESRIENYRLLYGEEVADEVILQGKDPEEFQTKSPRVIRLNRAPAAPGTATSIVPTQMTVSGIDSRGIVYSKEYDNFYEANEAYRESFGDAEVDTSRQPVQFKYLPSADGDVDYLFVDMNQTKNLDAATPDFFEGMKSLLFHDGVYTLRVQPDQAAGELFEYVKDGRDVEVFDFTNDFTNHDPSDPLGQPGEVLMRISDAPVEVDANGLVIGQNNEWYSLFDARVDRAALQNSKVLVSNSASAFDAYRMADKKFNDQLTKKEEESQEKFEAEQEEKRKAKEEAEEEAEEKIIDDILGGLIDVPADCVPEDPHHRNEG